MQKAGIILVASGGLMVIGLILLAVGNQIILEGVFQGNGKINSSQDLTIPGEFNSKESSTTGPSKGKPLTNLISISVAKPSRVKGSNGNNLVGGGGGNSSS